VSVWRHGLILLRAAVLCALLAFGLGPEVADAHVGDDLSSVTTSAVDDHTETHSLIEEALGHCHPGLDCAVSAIAAEPSSKGLAAPFDTGKFRLRDASCTGQEPEYDPPPPRPFV